MKSGFVLPALTAFLAAAPVLAAPTTYDLNRDFGSAPFQYGHGVGGATFIDYGSPMPNGDLLIYTNSLTSYPNLQRAPGGLSYSYYFGPNFGTFSIPHDGFTMSPGDGANSDSIVRFRAPAAATYAMAGQFTWLWTNNGLSDGVIASIFKNAGTSPLLLYTTTMDQGAPQTGPAFLIENVNLASGDTLDFVINNRTGNFSFDAIGLTGVITGTGTAAVPEPQSWAMLIAGFGLIGSVLRRKRISMAA